MTVKIAPLSLRCCLFVMSLLTLTVGLSACGDRAAAPSPAAQPVEPTTAVPPVDLHALILAAARARHPMFDHLQKQAVIDVNGMIQAKAGFGTLPAIGEEPDPALKALYAQAATLYEINEVIAAQALLREAGKLSPAGEELRALVNQAYQPVGDPDSLDQVQEGYSADEIAQELQDYAQRAAKGLASLRMARLEGQQHKLAELRVLAGVYHDTNGAAIDAAEAAIKLVGADPRTRGAIDKALADAAH